MRIKNKLVNALDKSICSYLGLKEEQITPHEVEMIDDELIVTSTTSFKRHVTREAWHQFSLFRTRINQDSLEKLGLAVGKALAKNFVVSFEENEIMRTDDVNGRKP